VATPCSYAYDVSTGDFNGDHKLDLLVTYSSTACPLSIFLGNGDGTFQEPPINTYPSYNPAATGIGDFNGDGKLDVAVAEQFGTISQVEILLGDGTGNFSPGATYPVGSFPLSIAVTDFRQNGKLDFAVATVYGGTDEFLGNGDGTFTFASESPTVDGDWVVAADLNGDGKPDLAVAQQGTLAGIASVAVILNNGDGTFQAPKDYLSGKVDQFIAAGDFNGDHKIDLLVPDYGVADVNVLLNTGVVSFSPTTPVNYPFQLVGSSSPPQTVTLTNTSAKSLTISSLSTQSPFHTHSTCGKTVAAGAACNIEITFTPQVPGKVTGSVNISDSASPKPQVIELTGAGTVAKLVPLHLTFPAQKVGSTSAPQNVTLTNQSNTSLSITQAYVDGRNYEDFSETNNCPSSLNAGASCTFTITFDPRKTGTRISALYILDNGGGSPQTIPLAGTGD
jgi:hypothetical protein